LLSSKRKPPTIWACSTVVWLAQNSVPLMLMAALVWYLYNTWGWDGLMRGGLVAIGLGFVVFIHELGHFVAAKMCDVHVSTFSLGFGPALPGCQFTYGETTYLIAAFPLGGYVAMVGETGNEGEEDEDYPRSFKNKSVWQRMFIISAGVIMNVLFGMLCFVLLYYNQGVARPVAVVWRTEPGSRAWEEGVRPGWRITKIDSLEKPFFDDLRYAVALSSGGSSLKFEFADRDGNKHERDLMPHRDENNEMPAIGVAPMASLKLFSDKISKSREASYTLTSAASKARVLPLGKGDTVEDGWDALARRLRDRKDDLSVKVTRAGGKTETISVPAVGFKFGDTLLGATDPAGTDPFDVSSLKEDAFEYRKRLALLAGKPMVFEVLRADGQTKERVFVPPAFHADFGLRMEMGKVAGIRKGSPVEGAGLSKGDVISDAGVRFGKETRWIGRDKLDPVRLPDELHRMVHSGPEPAAKARVVLKVLGVGHDAQKERELADMPWDDSWTAGDEGPMGTTSPMSVPQIGVAYWVQSTVRRVEKDSPADKAGLQPGDQIVQWRYKIAGPTPGKTGKSKWQSLASVRGKDKEVYDQWAHHFYALQRGDYQEAEFRVKRGGEMVEEEGAKQSWLGWAGSWVWGRSATPKAFGPLEARPDETWPLAERGLLLMSEVRQHKAETIVEAVGLGVDRSLSFIRQIYLNLRSLLTGRIAASSLGGPLEIASQAFSFAAEDWFVFLGFLGVISINLAVVNFLPIPVLDGGHMVFLLYEAIRGKRPSETVQFAAAIVGIVLLLALMVFVFYRDIVRNF
ncbi:MAG: site-2 protease family protein, partial [Gemmataceae bacterium]|nr:site-2 protease family protein [Gemmataceae bacterium]